MIAFKLDRSAGYSIYFYPGAQSCSVSVIAFSLEEQLQVYGEIERADNSEQKEDECFY